ncbi:hypothetical protein BN946_scf184844.g128 [Trametes cinnabarina]|uniref:F-box domain-containing protein n=1 Tax=Pycnoporus cinnabarinus TaxID=5643 RepID=A0A060SFT8_PYCCI|nr:hypothetical protein BN946_scf184844.g128 [Trametes cinnabarina]
MAPASICSLSPELIKRIATDLGERECQWGVDKYRASFAFTCRYISTPVLDVLWSQLNGLLPLLHTLPPDLVAAMPAGKCGCDRRFVMLRAPNAEDFRRFSIYACRVRKIALKSFGSAGYKHTDVITQEFWDCLVINAPKPFLPNLREFTRRDLFSFYYYRRYRECKMNDEHPSPCQIALQPFLGANLKRASFTLHSPPSGQPSTSGDTLRSMARVSPGLESLSLAYCDWHNPVHPSDLHGFTNLVKFSSSTGLPAGLLWGLGTLPRLREMEMSVPLQGTTVWDWVDFPHGREAGLFPSLVRLEASVKDILWTVSFIGTITSRSLSHIAVQHQPHIDSIPDELYESLCVAIADLPSHEYITFLAITTPVCQRFDTSFRGLPSRTVAPLLRLNRLQHLRTDGERFAVLVDDDMLDAMSRAWPDIRTLLLRSSDVWSGADPYDTSVPYYPPEEPIVDPDFPKASLSGLVPLVLRCPHLEEFTVPIDTRRRHDRTLRLIQSPPAALRARPSRVRVFHAPGSILEPNRSSRLTLATFLSLLFPNLAGIGPGRPRYSWHAVRELCEMLGEVRQQELRWWEARARTQATAKSEGLR